MTPMRARALRAAVFFFAALGIVLSTLLAVALWLDVRDFDRTRGGYDAPYLNYTGEPIDWSRLDQTATGMASRGRIVNVLIDCTSGMMTLESFGLQVAWRKFSPRAIAIHAPGDACRQRGFAPQFDVSSAASTSTNSVSSFASPRVCPVSDRERPSNRQCFSVGSGRVV